MKKQNKSQVTGFILIGLVVLGFSGIAYYLYNAVFPSAEIEEEILLEAGPVKEFINSCLDEVAVPGVYLLASNGGYISSFPRVLLTENSQVAYHLENSQDVSPSKEFMEQELSDFIGDSFIVCINDFDSFPQYTFEYGNMEVSSLIHNTTISVEVKYPITISQEDTQFMISEFRASYPIRLGHILDVKDRIASKIKISRVVDLDELSSNNLKATVMPYDEESSIYSLYDPESEIGESPFIFNFAVKERSFSNNAPVVRDISPQEAFVGQEYFFRIAASDPDNDALIFEDSSALFDISSEGEILFTPTAADIGDYRIPVTVSDGDFEVVKILELSIR